LLRESYSTIQDQRDCDDAARKNTTLATQGITGFYTAPNDWISQVRVFSTRSAKVNSRSA